MNRLGEDIFEILKLKNAVKTPLKATLLWLVTLTLRIEQVFFFTDFRDSCNKPINKQSIISESVINESIYPINLGFSEL